MLSRRAFVQQSILAGLASVAAASEPRPLGSGSADNTKAPPAKMPILDCHTHFYDPTRPQGVPWPGKDDKLLFRRVLPDEFQKLAAPHGVTGTIVVEASPWLEDNQWLLDHAAKNPFLVGIVGHLDPFHEQFGDHLARFARNRRFRGIRISHATVQKGLESRRFRNAMVDLSDRDLELDINGGPDMPADAARLARQLPDLRIVINHAANVRIDGKPPPDAWLKGMRDAARSRHVWCKVSALVEATGRADGTAPRDLAFYRPTLDALWDIFGENRLIYASNWPVSNRFATYATLFTIVRDFFQAKGDRALRKFFAGNATDAYKPVVP